MSKRPEDILCIVAKYIDHYAELYDLPRITLSASALDRMKIYGWPGNIRELENCVQYLTCLQLDHAIQPDELPLLTEEETSSTAHDPTLSFQKAKQELLGLFERDYLEDALRRSGGNISEAARASGKARRAFFELMRKHGVNAVGTSGTLSSRPLNL